MFYARKRDRIEKSHNVGRSGKRVNRRRKVARRKTMTLEERSAQVNRQWTCIVLGFAAVVIVVIIIICIINIGEKEKTDRGENGEYVGEREIDVREMDKRESNGTETNEEKLPEYNLYEATEEMAAEERFQFYGDAVRDIIYPTDKRSSDVLESLSDDDQIEWNTLFKQIEAEEEKKGDTENVADLYVLSPAEYRDISLLCYQAYFDLPQGGMATRYGRNAGDALKIGLEDGTEYAQLITDFNISNEGYVTSFRYRDCGQKLADRCYWAGDNFYQYLYHYSGVTMQEKEHCALTAYFYSFYGGEVSGAAGVQHKNDLKEMEQNTKKILIEQYDYPISLFGEK